LEKDLPATATGLGQLLAILKEQVKEPEQLLVLIEATGVLHLNWSATLTKAGYAVAVINPLIARRLYRVENSIRDNKSDPIDARGLCAIGALHGKNFWLIIASLSNPSSSPCNGCSVCAKRCAVV